MNNDNDSDNDQGMVMKSSSSSSNTGNNNNDKINNKNISSLATTNTTSDGETIITSSTIENNNDNQPQPSSPLEPNIDNGNGNDKRKKYQRKKSKDYLHNNNNNGHHHFNHHYHNNNVNNNNNQPFPQLNNLNQDDAEIAVFSELSHLCELKDGFVWREIARWVKYEENVEANGTRWSKPYVSTVNVAAFQELRDSFRNGVVIFDSQSQSLNQLIDEFCRTLRQKNLITLEESKQIANRLLLEKLHLFQTKRSLIRSLADMRNQSSNNFLKLLSGSTTKINTINENDNPMNSNSRSESEENVSNNDSKNNSKNGSSANLQNFNNQKEKEIKYEYKFNDAFMRKLPDNVVSNNILIAEVDFLQSPVSGFIRLQTATVLGNMTEVSIPTKFVYIYLGPKLIIPTTGLSNYEQIGRALGTLMSDTIFRQVAFKTQNISALVQALDDFLNESPILPPNLWDPSTRIEPPDKTPVSNKKTGRQMLHESKLLSRDSCYITVDDSINGSINNDTITSINNISTVGGNELNNENSFQSSQSYYNKAFFLDKTDKVITFRNNDSLGCFIDDKINLDSDDEEEMERKQMGLVRSGRWFGGLINDVKRKIPHYKSDFIDALSMQSVASIVFLYFACLTPIITFGGLLGDATGNNIATMESLVCGCLCGIVYGLFSGQPLTILGSTGPVLVFETIVYDFCRTYEYDYLALRFWIGIWTATILMIFVAFDLSYFVCYITRFTEENFASLISVIFIYKSIEKLLKINRDYPIHLHPNDQTSSECICLLNNRVNFTIDTNDLDGINGDNNDRIGSRCLNLGGTLYGDGCHNAYVPDVFLFSLILLTFTYIISIKLKSFTSTRFFTTNIRQMAADFSVPIAIVVMTVVDNLTGLPTPKLQVPNDFKPTLPTRTWIVSPFADANPSWMPLAAFLPATLATILIFMDQQITAVIVNRKENKLKKGCGYHLDLFVLSILICICSIFGLPWFVAATVLSITHVNSLQMVSQTAAPGDRPKFLGVREQRVTQIGIFTLCGLSIFFTPILQRIPMAVLYGVFLYMGVSSLHGSQFMDRIAIMFMPQKYQPDYMFLRRVKMYRVHLFTIIQVICFIFLWVVKSSKPISITFPLMLVVILGVRKLLDYVFTQDELKILDDKMPESKRKKKERTKERLSVMILKNKHDQQQQNGRRAKKGI